MILLIKDIDIENSEKNKIMEDQKLKKVSIALVAVFLIRSNYFEVLGCLISNLLP